MEKTVFALVQEHRRLKAELWEVPSLGAIGLEFSNDEQYSI